MKKFLEIFGWYGAVAIVSAYALNSFSIIQSNNALYQLLNFTGAIGIVVVSLAKKAYQPAALNIIWTVIAAIALIKLLF